MTEPPSPRFPSLGLRSLERWTAIGLTVLAVGYLLQIFSPLRLNHDAVRLLSMARAAHDTGSYLLNGTTEQYPLGYPMMVRWLLDNGLGRTMWLNLLNLLWLAAALSGWYWIGRRQVGLAPDAARLAVCLPLLSWVIIKHAVIPLTDLPYLGVSTFALLFLQRYWSTTDCFAWRDLGLALTLSAASWQIRTIGLALIAATVVSILSHPRTLRLMSPRLVPSAKMVVIGGIAAGLLFALLAQSEWFVACFANSYFLSLLAFLRGESAITPWHILIYRLSELASLILNLPLPEGFRLPAAIVGLISLVFLLAIVRPWWNRHRPWLLYGGFYLGILVLWPFTDPRFLLPLVPLAALLVVSASEALIAGPGLRQRLVTAFLLAYAALGLAALGYSTRLSLAGTGFARLYGLPDARVTYAHAFGLDVAPGSLPPHASWLDILHAFEPRAAPSLSNRP